MKNVLIPFAVQLSFWLLFAISPPDGLGAARRNVVLQTADGSRPDTIVWNAGEPVHQGMGTLELQLSIGLVEGPAEYVLGEVEDIGVGPDGSIVILESPSGRFPMVRRYDDQGRFLGTVGGVGSGPGEYRLPAGIAVGPEGTIALHDQGLGRTTIYDRDGNPLHTYPVGRLSMPSVRHGNLVANVDGSFSIRTLFPFSSDTDSVPGRDGEFVRFHPGDAQLGTVPFPTFPDVSLPVVRRTRRLEGGGEGTISLRVPYSPASIWCWSPFGYFVTARTDRYSLDVMPPEEGFEALDLPESIKGLGPGVTAALRQPGAPVLSIRRSLSPIELEREERAEQTDAFLERVRRIQGSLSGRIPEIPRTKPFLKVCRVGEHGRIWVSISTASVKLSESGLSAGEGERTTVRWMEPTVFDVFEPNGTYLGQVGFPEGVTPQIMRGDTVWTITRGEYDVSVVRRYGVIWK